MLEPLLPCSLLPLQTLKTERTITLPHSKNCTIGSMLYKHPYVLLGTSNGIIRLSVLNEKVVDINLGHSKLVHKMISVGDEIWSCSSDSTICVWDDVSEVFSKFNR